MECIQAVICDKRLHSVVPAAERGRLHSADTLAIPDGSRRATTGPKVRG